MPGPVPSGKEYGKYLDDRRAAETAAAGARRFMDSKQQNQTPANQQEEEDKSLRAGLVALGKMDKAKGATMTAEPGSSIEAVQQYSAQQPASPATDSWVPEPPMEQLPDESGLTQGMPSEVGVKFDPAIHDQPAVVDQTNMPPAETVDPAEGLPPVGSAGALMDTVSQASADQVKVADSLAKDPETRKKIEDKANAGIPMDIVEKIAWIGMLVAPVALGYAMKGEKGALLGGMAAGKGLEKLGEGLTEKEKQESKFAQEEKMKDLQADIELEKIAAKSKNDKEKISSRTGVASVIDGKPVMTTLRAREGGGTDVEIIKDAQGNVVGPMVEDEATGLYSTPPTQPTPKGYRQPPATITEEDGKTVVTPPPAVVIKKSYPKAQKESFASILSRKGIESASFDPDMLQMDYEGWALSGYHAGENPRDVDMRKKQFEKIQDLIKEKDARDAALADYTAKEGITSASARGKESLNTLQSKYDKDNPWKLNKVVLGQADHRNAATYAKNDPSSITKNGVTYKSDPFGKMRRSDAQGIDDVGLLYTMIKMLDPGSVVREGEIYMVSSASPLMAQMEKLYGRVFAGGAALGNDERQYINRLISAKVASAYSEQEKHERTYQKLAEDLNVDFRLVQDPMIAVEMRDVEKAKSRATGIPSFKNGEISGMAKLKEGEIFFIENGDGTFGAYTKEKINGQYKPKRI